MEIKMKEKLISVPTKVWTVDGVDYDNEKEAENKLKEIQINSEPFKFITDIEANIMKYVFSKLLIFNFNNKQDMELTRFQIDSFYFGDLNYYNKENNKLLEALFKEFDIQFEYAPNFGWDGYYFYITGHKLTLEKLNEYVKTLNEKLLENKN